YQVQTQRRSLLQAQQAVGNARDKLARIIGLVTPRSLETPAIETVDVPVVQPAASVAALQTVALERRGDYLAAKLAVQARQTEANAAGHELLPKLDFVAGVSLLGGSGASATGDAGYWASYQTDTVGWSA